MLKNKEVYAIQRDDGMFYCDWDFPNGVYKPKFTRSIELCFLKKQFGSKRWCETEIRCNELINCKPVRVDFRIGEPCDQLDVAEYSMNSIIHTMNTFNKRMSMLKDYCKRNLQYFEELKVYGLTDEDKARKYTYECFLEEIEKLEKEVI